MTDSDENDDYELKMNQILYKELKKTKEQILKSAKKRLRALKSGKFKGK
jgi:hypothetical protein